MRLKSPDEGKENSGVYSMGTLCATSGKILRTILSGDVMIFDEISYIWDKKLSQARGAVLKRVNVPGNIKASHTLDHRDIFTFTIMICLLFVVHMECKKDESKNG